MNKPKCFGKDNLPICKCVWFWDCLTKMSENKDG